MEKYIVWVKKEGRYGILQWLELNEPYIIDFNINNYVKQQQEIANRNKADLQIIYTKITLKTDSMNTIYDPNYNIYRKVYCNDHEILSPIKYTCKFGDIVR